MLARWSGSGRLECLRVHELAAARSGPGVPCHPLRSASARPTARARPGWTELSAQQLVRYEALFSLLDDVQLVNDISDLDQRVAPRWKYFANVTSWRLVVAKGEGFAVIDGHRGEATVAEVTVLDPWDEHYWTLQRPHLIPLAETTDGPALPAHLTTRGVVEIEVLPITRRRAAGADPPTPARRPTQPELRSCHSNVGGGCHTQICTGFSPCGGAGGRHSDKESSSTTSGEGFPTGYPLENQSPPI